MSFPPIHFSLSDFRFASFAPTRVALRAGLVRILPRMSHPSGCDLCSLPRNRPVAWFPASARWHVFQFQVSSFPFPFFLPPRSPRLRVSPLLFLRMLPRRSAFPSARFSWIREKREKKVKIA